jgi:hypothetical protein
MNNFNTFNQYHDKIISFSLWGDSEFYNYGIVENAIVAQQYLPEFKIYVYYNNTVLSKTFNILKSMQNVCLIHIDNNIKNAYNMLWRLKPCFHSKSVVFIRDADSLINKRDIFVIRDFLGSDREICSIKDTGSHLKYAIIGGGVGCKNGILNKYLNYYNTILLETNISRGADQHFLIQIFYENISNIHLYTYKNVNHNNIYENKITYIEPNDKHIGSYNYYTPMTRSLLNEENNSLTVKRYYSFDQQSFLSAFKLITLIPDDGGPGNQIIGIKECLIISRLLNRICLIPPIREHYLKSNTTFYNFNDIFNIKMIGRIIIDDTNMTILNNIGIKDKYVIHGNYINKKLRHELLIKPGEYNEILLNNRTIKNADSLEELKKNDDNMIVIKHLFNNVAIHECCINGCFNCKLNTHFEYIYKDICSIWDYSEYIKNIGDEYIFNNFNNKEYVSMHIRLPDVINNTLTNTFSDNNNIDNNDNIMNDEKLVYIVNSVKNNIKDGKQLYIASNNIHYLKKVGLTFNYFNINDTRVSFIDQYICCNSSEFYYLNLCNFRYNTLHERSTWTSFVIDYRNFFNKKGNNINLNKKK